MRMLSPKKPGKFQIVFCAGLICLFILSLLTETLPFISTKLYKQQLLEILVSSGKVDFNCGTFQHTNINLPEESNRKWISWNGLTLDAIWQQVYTGYRTGKLGYNSIHNINLLGFHCFRVASTNGSYYTPVYSFSIPLWTLLIWPTITLIRYCRFIKLHKITTKGLCPTCHYDLRATPTRCPECGRQTTPEEQLAITKLTSKSAQAETTDA